MLDPVVTAEDPFSSLSETEIISPCQSYERIRRDPSEQPEKRLMLAVLEDAVKTFQDSLATVNHRRPRLLREVEEWFASTDVTWPFSFENVCTVLGIDPDSLRLGLSQWRVHQFAQQKLDPTPPCSLRRVNDLPRSLSTPHPGQPKHKAA